jgi:hypothetical protein
MEKAVTLINWCVELILLAYIDVLFLNTLFRISFSVFEINSMLCNQALKRRSETMDLLNQSKKLGTFMHSKTELAQNIENIGFIHKATRKQVQNLV